MNLNNNFFKTVDMSDNEVSGPCLTERRQNNLNSNQLSSRRVCGFYYSKAGFSCSKRMGIGVIAVTGFFLLAGIIAVGASMVMLAMVGAQQTQIQSLLKENTEMKARIEVERNTTASQSDRIAGFEKQLLESRHQNEMNSLKCDQEKGNISSLLKAEIRDSEQEKNSLRVNLASCEREKHEISETLGAQKTDIEAEKRALVERLERCEENKKSYEQILQQIRETTESLKANRCPPCPSRSLENPRSNSATTTRMPFQPFPTIVCFFVTVIFVFLVFSL